MNERLRALLAQLKALWVKWSATQKAILFAVLGAAVLAVVLISAFSAAPSMVPLIGTPVKEENDRARIIGVLDQEGVKYKAGPDNMIYVEDEKTARRVRTIFFREDLIPARTDPWAIFDVERWPLTDL